MSTPELWEQRFLATRIGLPHWAEGAPERTLLTSNATGTWELYTWTPGGRPRQVTDRPNGTSHGELDPTGELVWWFDDTDGDELGVWRVEPYDGSAPPRPAHPDLAPGYDAGLALGWDGTAYVGRSDDDGTQIWRIRPAAPTEAPFLLYASAEDAYVADVTRDGALVALSHSEHGDSRHPALRLVTPTGDPVADLYDGPGRGLDALGFAPTGRELLVGHERRGRPELLRWDPAAGLEEELLLDLPGELAASWYHDGGALLVHHSHGVRAELYRYDLAAAALRPIGTPRGVVGSAGARPDGTVWFSWSSGSEPSSIRALPGDGWAPGETTGDDLGTVVITPDGPRPPRGVPFEDIEVATDAGTVAALMARPSNPAAVEPYPAVFMVHGGPTAHDQDTYTPAAAALADAGYAVVLVNYRGSTGYGSAWRDAIEAAPGRTELIDIAAVRAHLVATGVLDGSRVALSGGSWGGYLTLLGLGTQPGDWRAGVAAVPVADYVAAYQDEMEGLKAFDRSLFGGSPAEVPDAYEVASPITYVAAVRAPVLVLAGQNDPRCPIRQIDNYLTRLADLTKSYEVYRFDAGHGSLVVAERIRQMRVELDFLARHLPRRPPDL